MKCNCCGLEKKETDFYKSYSVINKATGKMTICKDCIFDIYNEFINKQTDNETALYKLCQLLDIYFEQPLFQSAKEESEKKGSSPLATYFVKVNSLKQYKDKTFKDSKELKINNENIMDFGDFEINQDTIIFWGKGYTTEQYFSLQNFYDDFVAGYECDSPAQVLNFKNAAKTQLMADEALAKQDVSTYNQLMKTLSTILGDSNVKPVQATGAEASDQITFGTLLKKYENDRPVLKPLDDEMKKYINTYMVGHLAKMEGLNNEIVEEYENSIKEYTVDFNESNIEEDE